MAPREPTRAQLSSRLTYDQKTPAFLRRLQNKVAGVRDEEDEDEDGYEYGYEYEEGGSHRPPIPKRPAIPERPSDDPGSAEEDEGDEAPQIVVLKEGKHLGRWEVENEKRKARGLPPLPRPASPEFAAGTKDSPQTHNASDNTQSTRSRKPDTGLTFSSGGGLASTSTRKKRKLISDADADGSAAGGAGAISAEGSSNKKKTKKKPPKVTLSFAGDDAL